ncbi:hypothetical protein C5167_043591 [Papaver somniferum]|uniref:BURP domain-containing protein n=1 Tax=Papaver somniferum TaxID=3469 RepID=A0A4Y7L644_PAPSO|nr:BURP domain protein RD22-like [Papaver somniferum]RZC81014.1 hypothetical protein C5167_043591 [Papaver somniferum]
MKFLHFILFFASLLIAAALSHATHPAEVYWRNVLPNTPMPKIIQDLLRSGSSGKPGGRTEVNVDKQEIPVNTSHARYTRPTPIPGYTRPSGSFRNYHRGSEDQKLLDNPNSALIFLEKDLHSGTKMNLQFFKTTKGAIFMPRQVVKSKPFSSNKLTDILSQFSVDPKSKQAEVIKETIKECEAPSESKEQKYCATSLESMIDFSTSKLGKNVNALATEMNKEVAEKQEYVVQSGVKQMKGDNSIVCHGQPYLYAVYYCHATHATRAYVVPLVGNNGTKIKAVALCHTDTASWNPKHMAFQVLKVKPGTVPVCHFLPEDHILWATKN